MLCRLLPPSNLSDHHPVSPFLFSLPPPSVIFFLMSVVASLLSPLHPRTVLGLSARSRYRFCSLTFRIRAGQPYDLLIDTSSLSDPPPQSQFGIDGIQERHQWDRGPALHPRPQHGQGGLGASTDDNELVNRNHATDSSLSSRPPVTCNAACD